MPRQRTFGNLPPPRAGTGAEVAATGLRAHALAIQEFQVEQAADRADRALQAEIDERKDKRDRVRRWLKKQRAEAKALAKIRKEGERMLKGGAGAAAGPSAAGPAGPAPAPPVAEERVAPAVPRGQVPVAAPGGRPGPLGPMRDLADQRAMDEAVMAEPDLLDLGEAGPSPEPPAAPADEFTPEDYARAARETPGKGPFAFEGAAPAEVEAARRGEGAMLGLPQVQPRAEVVEPPAAPTPSGAGRLTAQLKRARGQLERINARIAGLPKRAGDALEDTRTALRSRVDQLESALREAKGEERQERAEATAAAKAEEGAITEQETQAAISALQGAQSEADLHAAMRGINARMGPDIAKEVRPHFTDALSRIKAATRVAGDKTLAAYEGHLQGEYGKPLRAAARKMRALVAKGDKQGVHQTRLDAEEKLRALFTAHMRVASMNEKHAPALIAAAKAKLTWALSQLPEVPQWAIAEPSAEWQAKLGPMMEGLKGLEGKERQRAVGAILDQARIHAVNTGNLNDYNATAALLRARTVIEETTGAMPTPWQR